MKKSRCPVREHLLSLVFLPSLFRGFGRSCGLFLRGVDQPVVQGCERGCEEYAADDVGEPVDTAGESADGDYRCDGDTYCCEREALPGGADAARDLHHGGCHHEDEHKRV